MEQSGGLEARVAALEKVISRPWWVSALLWVAFTLLPAMAVSAVAVYVENMLTASVTLEAGVNKENAPGRGLMQYHLAIKNTGDKTADEVKGFVEVWFEDEIVELTAQHAFLNGSYVVNGEGVKRDNEWCVGRELCRIKFGNLAAGGGKVNLRFKTRGLMAFRPEIQYAGKPPRKWVCTGVRNALQRECKN